jgi:hypothetical protein
LSFGVVRASCVRKHTKWREWIMNRRCYCTDSSFGSRTSRMQQTRLIQWASYDQSI